MEAFKIAFGVLGIITIVSAITAAIIAWPIMLIVGAAYHEFGFWEPIGYFKAYIVSLIIGFIVSLISR